MPWTMEDYPDSLKNLNEVTRKKAIDMANAMVDEGYEEGRAIPIATAQAEKWYDNASKKEKDEYMKEGDPTTRGNDSSHRSSSSSGSSSKNKGKDKKQSKSGNEALEVVAGEGGWSVRKKDSDKSDKTFDTKSEATDYAKDEAKDKGIDAVIYKENGEVQHHYSYSEDN